MSNLFVVNAGRLRDAARRHRGVAGVMRGIVLRECAALGIRLRACATSRSRT